MRLWPRLKSPYPPGGLSLSQKISASLYKAHPMLSLIGFKIFPTLGTLVSILFQHSLSQPHPETGHHREGYTYAHSNSLIATFWLSPIFTFAPAFLPNAFPHLMVISRTPIRPFLLIPILFLAQTSSIAGIEYTTYFIKHTNQQESPLMPS